MLLCYCISNGDRQAFHGDMIIVIRVFPSLFYHCKMKFMFSVEKNPTSFTMALCINAVVNI